MFKSRMMIAANSAISHLSGQLETLSKFCKLSVFCLFFFSVLVKICEMTNLLRFYLN